VCHPVDPRLVLAESCLGDRRHPDGHIWSECSENLPFRKLSRPQRRGRFQPGVEGLDLTDEG
jgi:hypothetical protein